MSQMPSTSTRSEMAENIAKAKDKLIQVYEMLPNYCLKDEIPDLLDNLKDAMKSYVVVESKHEALKKSKQKVVHNFMERASNSNDPEKKITLDEISELLKNTFNQEVEKNGEDVWSQDPLYRSMKPFVDEELPNHQETNDDEDDLAVTGVTIQTIDPYSKREFSDPVKNVNCNHSYEKAIIYELMAKNPKVRCYWMGCSNRTPVKSNDLVPDDDLKRHMTRMKARVAI